MTTAGAPGVPLLARLDGQRVVAVGGGTVAAAKLAPLLTAGADVVVVAPELDDALRAAAGDGRLAWRARAFQPGDLDGALLVLAATDDPTVNDHVARAAADRSTLCVRVDDGDGAPGTAALLAAVRRGDLLLAVSTGGRAPALARQLRVELEDRYGPEYAALVALLGELRRDPEVRARLAELDPRERRRRWRALAADGAAWLRAGSAGAARDRARAVLLA